MKGVVFNLLEQLVVRDFGEDKLVQAAAETLAMPADDVVVWLGRNALPLFAERYPQLFEPHDSARPFVRTLNDIIHPEVRKLYPGADVRSSTSTFAESFS